MKAEEKKFLENATEAEKKIWQFGYNAGFVQGYEKGKEK